MPAPLQTLSQACTPRQSVFDKSRRDVVLYIGDLLSGKLNEQAAKAFFSENYVTKGMESLIHRVFERVTGKKDQASTFLLSQAMGGGKTHSMLALGLLAKYPAARKAYWARADLGTEEIRVIGFDGRESDYPFGIWGALAEQLGKREVFKDLYSPLQAPGVSSWIRLLQGPPTVILLDELPPYFMAALSKQVGSSNLASVTTTALANLMVAANKDELSNVAVVISDLSATAYHQQGAGVSTALDDLKQETNRSALVIEPVATQGDEVFDILRTRLFETLPEVKEVDAVAVAYAEAVKKAKQMELTAATPEAFAAEIRDSYPFHFSLRDLYGRFKANPEFQQTRGLLRIMRAITANLWNAGRADELYLIHPYDIDLNDTEVFTEFDRINSSLSEAVRSDIANVGAAHSEQLDAELATRDATDAAKLIYVSSLSVATQAVIGLRDTEVVAWLCRPGRSVERLLADVLEVLPNRAWYLHLSTDGRLYFKNVQNLAARLHSMVGTFNKEIRVKELRDYLAGLFAPTIKDLYQEVKVLPPLDEVSLQPDKVTLVVTDPYPGAKADSPLHPDWEKFYRELTWQNRVLFLTGDRDTMDRVLENAAYLRAVNAVLDEQEQEHMSPKDPQAQEANRSLDKYLVQLRSSVQQTFATLVYPSSGRLRMEDIRFTFDNNQYVAENEIRGALENNHKFSTEGAGDTWVKKAEERLFDGQNPVPWSEVKKRAAAKSEWQFHHPHLLEDLKDYALRMGSWRVEGDMIRRGPFPKEATKVSVQVKSRDMDTGEALLRIIPEGGDKVYYELGTQKPTTASQEVSNFQEFRTAELVLTFLCVDEGPDKRPTGDPVTWKNSISLKGRFYGQGKDTFFEVISIPQAQIRYTSDGSSPLSSGIPYEGALAVPAGCKVIQAVAEKNGIRSSVESFPVAARPGIDPAKKALWSCGKRFSKLPPSEWHQVIQRCADFGGLFSEVDLDIISADTGEVIMYTLPEQQYRKPDELLSLVVLLQEQLTRPNTTMTIKSITFEKGQGLLDWIHKDKLGLDTEKEVRQ